MSCIRKLQSGKLQTEIYDSRDNMGRAAAAAAAERLRKLLSEKETVNMIFAAAPSQNETLHYLSKEEGIDWKRVNAFHMDEYIGLDPAAPQAFGNYLREHIFSLLPFGSVNYINASATDIDAECARYSALLRENPVDIVCLGIGENAHIAFNDPGVADFNDPALVKPVPLDDICRQQQVNDGCFAKIGDVPTHALSLTIPALTNAAHLICTVPAPTKAWAVEHTVLDEITESVPATIMRRHADAVMFCDSDSGKALLERKPIKIAFAGLRHSHIFALVRAARENPDVEITGAWEEHEATVCDAKEQITEPFYPSYDALLADPEVDIVGVGDYYGIRGDRIIRALKAGKHVMVDKPVCTSLDELAEIEKLSAEKGLKVGCMLTLRYDAAVRSAADIIGSGKLGKIHSVNFTGQHPLDYLHRAGWYFEEGKHGGTFNDIAIHGIDAIKVITGLRYSETLCARSWNHMASNAPDFPDGAQFMGKLESGAGLIGDVSYAAPSPSGYSLPTYWRFAIFGENGYVEFKYGKKEMQIAYSGDTAATTFEATPVKGNYLAEFISEIRGEEVMFDTASVIDSARATLELQAFADKYGKEV